MSQVAPITGCSSGNGSATALRLARQGFRVPASMRDAGERQTHLHPVAEAGDLPLEILSDHPLFGAVPDAPDHES